MPLLDLPNGRLHYTSEGYGPPIVLIHAGVADSRMWDRQAAAWRDQYQVVRYDLRGFGQSPLPDGEFANHDDLLAVADHLGLERFWLVGNSYGGLIAVDFTLEHPERVAGLVLVAPGVSGAEPTPSQEAFNELEEALYDEGKLEEASWLNVERWVDGPFRGPDVVDQAVRRQVFEMQLAAFNVPEPENLSIRRLDPPAIGRLGKISAPTMVIAGALDVPGMLERAEILSNGIPHAHVQVVDDAAHLISLEKPDWFNHEVAAFIADHS